MEKYCEILHDVLEIDYKLRAAVSVLQVLEGVYSEEENYTTRILITLLKGYFESVQQDTIKIADYLDRLTIKK